MIKTISLLFLLSIILLVILATAVQLVKKKPSSIRIPAEYEPQDYVILVSPSIDTSITKDTNAPLLSNNINKERLHKFGLGEGFNTIADVQAQEIKALRNNIHVIIIFRNKDNKKVYDGVMKRHGIDSKNDYFSMICPSICDIWVRDTGPIVGYKVDGTRFGVWARWVQWGYYQPKGVMFGPNFIIGKSPPWGKASSFEEWSSCDIPNKLAKCICDNLSIETLRPWMGKYMYAGEGGNKSFNGKGGLICSKVVEHQRNPHLTTEQLEEIFRIYYGITKVIWVGAGVDNDQHTFKGAVALSLHESKTVHGHGLPSTIPIRKGGENVWVPIGTGGHIDEWCRFVDTDKIILSYVPDYVKLDKISIITKKRMENNYKMIKKKYPELTIYRIPDAPLFYTRINSTDGIYSIINSLNTQHTWLPSEITIVSAGSYINYMISNNVIIMPKYYEESSELASDITIKRTDDEAGQMMATLFPNRKIVRINNLPLNFGGGGFHCTYMQIPRKLT